MRRLSILLGNALDRHKSHSRAPHRFADRLGIDPVVLAALDVGLHKLGTDELHTEPLLLQLSRPVMG